MDWVIDCQKQLADETNFELWKHQLKLFLMITMFGDVVAG